MNARIFLCVALLGLAAGPVAAQSRGQIKLPEFPSLADKASESVVVTLDQKLLGFAASWLSDKDPEEAKAKQIVNSLTGVYVRSYTFEKDYAYPKAEIDAVRRQLDAPGWSRIVEARSKHEQSDVNVFMYVEGDKAHGLAIIASEPREFTIVNIVGSIRLEDLHDLEGNFGVPKLDIETGKEAPAPKQEAPKPRKP
ncbi:MAG TPA: DUF4252 domain-containing protein [Steroidobacteraceae bacterium]|jgi:hypothetical protein|nr:DUF4252 domain-containing protein [Steroidobacteraceae bacterium]